MVENYCNKSTHKISMALMLTFYTNCKQLDSASKATYNISKHIGQFCLSTFHIEQTDSVGSSDRQSVQLSHVTMQLF